MSFLINPYAFLVAGGDYESIATVTVGSGGASSIEFTSIPGTYQHLQVRFIARVSRASAGFSNLQVFLNSDTTGANYARHLLYGDGAAAAATANASSDFRFVYATANDAAANVFAANVLDILDYSSSSKATTMRAFVGWDNNGSGSGNLEKGTVGIASGLWTSTNAVTTIKIQDAASANFAQHSTAALYGIKAP